MCEEWNLNDLLGDSTPQQMEAQVIKLSNDFEKVREKLTNNITPKELYEIIKHNEKIKIISSKLSSYYELDHETKTSDAKLLAEISRLNQVFTDLGNKMVFFPLWLMNLEDNVANKLINSEELKEFKYYLQEIRKEKKYSKSEEIEKIINLKSITGGSAFGELYGVFSSEFKFEFDGKKDLPQEEIIAKFKDKDPKVRKKAYETIYGKYGEHSTVFSEMYKNIVLDWHNEDIKIRGYSSAINVRNQSNDIPDKAVEALINVVRKNVFLFQDYFKIKHEMISKQSGKYDFSRYHLYAPYDTGLPADYDYEKSKKIAFELYEEFDSRFAEMAKKIFNAKHVHSHPAVNKRSGAFCAGITSDVVPYVLLNHANTLNDLFTLVHEFGHGIHDILASKHNEFYNHPALPMAETASIFSEGLLSKKIRKESDNVKEKVAILVHTLDGYYAAITRQTYFVEFEKFAHENIPKGVTKEELDTKYMNLLKEQFGDMIVPEVFKHEWNYVPHIHYTPFYCYAYAWGNLSVLALQKMYEEQGEPFKEKYIDILAAGSSKSPAEILSIVGINPEDEKFWQKGFDVIKEEIEELKNYAKQL